MNKAFPKENQKQLPAEGAMNPGAAKPIDRWVSIQPEISEVRNIEKGP